MDCVTTIAQKIMEYTTNAIGQQLGYLISYRSNIEALMEKLESLEAEQSAMQHSIDEATRNGEKIEVEVQNWMKKADDITRLGQQFYGGERQENFGCTGTSCPNLYSRCQLSQRAEKMALEVDEIRGNRTKFHRISYLDSPQWIHESTIGKSNEGFESRISIVRQIMEALKEPNVKMVGLCGLPGVGKTTLAKEVAKKMMKENMFEKVVMVTVSNNPNLEKIQGEIAVAVGMNNLDEKYRNIRASRLHERLKQERNMLLILDDLWKKVDLCQIGVPFDDDNKNEQYCKILLTSRNERVLSDEMRCKRNIRVGVLCDNEAWALFKRIAELPDDFNLLSVVAEKIVQRCGGLPLRIVATAGALRNKDPCEWRDALRRLESPLQRNITGIDEADSILRLSYDNLSQDVQPIFLLSAMLSYNPLIIDLLMYSVGLNLLQGVDTMEQARDGIEVLMRKLKATYLLYDSYRDCFSMHDVVRDVALSIASNEKHSFVVRHRSFDWPDKNVLEGYTRILLDKSDINDLPQELYCPRLELLLLNSMGSDLRLPNTFFKSMNELKALGFTDMHFSSLPSSLSLLEKLRTLCLHSCLLEDITEVGRLKSLKVLSLAYSDIKQLPYEMAQLTCLQMLNLAHCSKLEVIPPKLLSSLKRLEALYMENSFNQWEAEESSQGNENASLAELRHLRNLSSLNIHIPDASVLPKDLFVENSLERYNIFIGNMWGWPNECESSKTLKLKLDNSIYFKYGIQKLLESVEDLSLAGNNDVLSYLDECQFAHLKHLWIENNDQVEYVVSNSTRRVAFSNLETLNLHHLKGLKKLCQGSMMAASFQNLRVIKVRNCDELKIIFPVLTVGLFSQLVEIDIDECNSLNRIVVSANEYSFHKLRFLSMTDLPALGAFHFEEDTTDNESNKNVRSLFNNKVSFPVLETLDIGRIKSSITSIWDDHLSHNSFGNLKTLIVRNCGFLVKLVPLHVLICLRNLEKLEVEDCESLEMVFDFDDLNNYKETQLSWIVPLKKIEFYRLPKLMQVWSDDPQQIFSFQRLRQVTVFSCERLKSLFPAFVAKGLLHLEELEIYNCGINVIVAKAEVLDSGAATFVFPKLNKLQLESVPNLKNLYEDRHTSEWPCLQGLRIGDCDELEIFGKEDSSSSSLQKESPYLKYPLFSHEKVIPNLKKLTVRGKQLTAMLWKDQLGFAATFLSLKELRVDGFGFFKERFLKPFRDDCFQLDLIFPNLESLDVANCDNLIKLGPSFISFKNLTDINVQMCNKLTSLLTSSTATSLVQLTRLRIWWCDKIEEIIAKEGDDDVEKEIINFKKLRCLELVGLPRLKSFCSHNYTFMFPSLNEVYLGTFSSFSMFCPGDIHAPLLKGIKWEYNEKLLETNLNKTIQQLFTQEVTYMQLYPDMGNLWIEKLPYHKPFSKLESLIVDNCDFLCEYVIPAHLVKSLSNLKKLEVRNCHSVKTIFDVKGIELDEEAHTSLPNIALRKLKLHHLPNLKYVWTQEHDGIGCFQYLEVLSVRDCESLRNIFVESTAKGLTQLKKLIIESCGVLEVIVAKDEASSEESPCNFVFPKLSHLTLWKLPNLRSFYPQRCSFKCPQLTRLFVNQCENLKTFGATMKELREKDEAETQQPLFLVEKVIPRLEALTLNQKDLTIIRNGEFQADLFDQVQVLFLESFSNEPASFPYILLERFPILEMFGVVRCCFEEILPSQAQIANHMGKIAPFKELYVGYMDKLKTIWNDDSDQLQPIHQDLEGLHVECCGSLIELTPPFALFGNLIYLRVSGCHQLIYLVTSSTARSLVNLETLEIKDCTRMGEIVRNESEDVEARIRFNKLQKLKLTDLPSLRNFCSDALEFPYLQTLAINGCHQMKTFCPGVVETPNMAEVEIDDDVIGLRGDLNKTIELLLLWKDGKNM